jgi:hypothetical protein
MRPIDLLKLTETNEFLTTVILNKVTELLNNYDKFSGFNEGNGFVNLFNANCLLTGSTMIEFLLGERYLDSNIDIFTNTVFARDIMINYLLSQGYTTENNNDNDSESGESETSSNESESGESNSETSSSNNNLDDLFETNDIINQDSGYSDIDNRFENRFGFPEENNSDTSSNFYRENAREQRENRSPISRDSISYDSFSSNNSSNNETLLNESDSEHNSDSEYESDSNLDSEIDDTFEIYTLHRRNLPSIKIVFKEITIDDYIDTIDLDICQNYFYQDIAYSHDLFDKKTEVKINRVAEFQNRISKYINRGFEFKLTI